MTILSKRWFAYNSAINKEMISFSEAPRLILPREERLCFVR